jgi:hypothetical protein
MFNLAKHNAEILAFAERHDQVEVWKATLAGGGVAFFIPDRQGLWFIPGTGVALCTPDGERAAIENALSYSVGEMVIPAIH